LSAPRPVGTTYRTTRQSIKSGRQASNCGCRGLTLVR
jgi:hypothetical protein